MRLRPLHFPAAASLYRLCIIWVLYSAAVASAKSHLLVQGGSVNGDAWLKLRREVVSAIGPPVVLVIVGREAKEVVLVGRSPVFVNWVKEIDKETVKSCHARPETAGRRIESVSKGILSAKEAGNRDLRNCCWIWSLPFVGVCLAQNMLSPSTLVGLLEVSIHILSLVIHDELDGYKRKEGDPRYSRSTRYKQVFKLGRKRSGFMAFKLACDLGAFLIGLRRTQQRPVDNAGGLPRRRQHVMRAHNQK
ncbi:hypothetical protein C8J56DRAFT_890075 [Mycena floridula]|nr:hypothetical protein C8J56DRAFT_890075 [Mycena floridula]